MGQTPQGERKEKPGAGREEGLRFGKMEKLRELRVGFIGAGRMASAVAQAMLLAVTYHVCGAETLAECTAKMDPDTWNAYHIVSNRARAVCYATRQMQFKRRAEHTVNALVSTAASQLEAMKILKALTSESLQQVVSSQEKLLVQQETLQGSQEKMEESIHSNLDQLAQEKALIASGQQQVAQLIEGITRRMENVSSHLNSQDADLQEGHRAILRDLTQVQKRAQEVYSKIETNLGMFVAYQNQTTLYYDELMRKLQKMNESLGLVLYTMDRMQSNVEGQLQHIQRFISWAEIWGKCWFCFPTVSGLYCQIKALQGGTECCDKNRLFRENSNHANDIVESEMTYLTCSSSATHILSLPGFSLSSIYTCILHGSYFLLAALVMTFLQIPGLPRAMLLVFVVANALLELNHAVSLGFNSLTGILVLAVAGKYGLDFFSPLAIHVPLERFHHQHLGSAFHLFPNSRSSSPNESMVSDMSTCSASLRPLCQGVTRTGQPCRKKAIPGHSYCHIHESGQSSYVG
ncbi:hypothetical protein JD844_015455 [Phrynosoma platyrhinos]|uniref:Uncharacterized protein n=1 Tax=Phrynosoma platyrhinos TaxID=52577 RepID=A0ABQ7SJ38_PHRPL|nr:hypothetical protein JD844_015455 [Phrynosoma platyrhinos]